MGSRGPQPLPSNVHALRGNPSKLSAAELAGEFNPEVEIPTSPKWLWPEAKKEWRRIGTELVRYGLVSKLDRAALTLYCMAWARLVWAETMLARAMDQAETKRLEAEARGEIWTGGDGIQVPVGSSGAMQYSHHWVVQRRAAQEVHWYLQSFGMSPSSRGRVRTSDNRQAALFDLPGEDKWKL